MKNYFTGLPNVPIKGPRGVKPKGENLSTEKGKYNFRVQLKEHLASQTRHHFLQSNNSELTPQAVKTHADIYDKLAEKLRKLSDKITDYKIKQEKIAKKNQ